MIFLMVILLSLGLTALWFFLLAVCHWIGFRWARVLGCRMLGWHDGDGGITDFDGCSLHSRCSVCGREVMQDSQGNWF